YHYSQNTARDPEGVDRLKGRLYRLRYQHTPRAPKFDLATESDDQLIARLASGNIYFRETAQRILTERLSAAGRAVHSAPRGGVRTHCLTALRLKLEKLVLSAEAAGVGKLNSKSEIRNPKSEVDQSLVAPAATAIERKARRQALWALIGSG